MAAACLLPCSAQAAVELQIPLSLGARCVFVDAQVYVSVRVLKWPFMMLQLRANEFDVIVCGGMA